MTMTAWPEPLTEGSDTSTVHEGHGDSDAEQPQRFGGPATHLSEWGTSARGLSQRVAATIASGRSVSPGQTALATRPLHAATYGMPAREVSLVTDPVARLKAHLTAIGTQAAASLAVLALPMVLVAWAASGLWNSGQIDTDRTAVSVPQTGVEQTITHVGANLSHEIGTMPAQAPPAQ